MTRVVVTRTSARAQVQNKKTKSQPYERKRHNIPRKLRYTRPRSNGIRCPRRCHKPEDVKDITKDEPEWMSRTYQKRIG